VKAIEDLCDSDRRKLPLICRRGQSVTRRLVRNEKARSGGSEARAGVGRTPDMLVRPPHSTSGGLRSSFEIGCAGARSKVPARYSSFDEAQLMNAPAACESESHKPVVLLDAQRQ
jgi:hypothetical protein